MKSADAPSKFTLVVSLTTFLTTYVTVTDNGVAKRRVLTNLPERHGSPNSGVLLEMENNKWSCFYLIPGT